MTDDHFDAYHVLRVDPEAEDFIIEAAFRALARRFHPDGTAPNHDQMADINRAFEMVRTPERRKRYDRLRHPLNAMGPGSEEIGPGAARSGEPWALRRPAPPPPVDDRPGAVTIDFGRYAGWSLKDLAKHDPDYLRWLSRHSSGVRYRNLILRLLPDEAAEPSRR